MLKKDERQTNTSCWNKAEEDEPVFVLLGRDAAIVETIEHWIVARIRRNKNKHDDDQIVEARQFIQKIKDYQRARAEKHANAHIKK